MTNFRIFRDSLGYHVQEDKGDFDEGHHYFNIWIENWVTRATFQTLSKARKVKEELEIQDGRVVE